MKNPVDTLGFMTGEVPAGHVEEDEVHCPLNKTDPEEQGMLPQQLEAHTEEEQPQLVLPEQMNPTNPQVNPLEEQMVAGQLPPDSNNTINDTLDRQAEHTNQKPTLPASAEAARKAMRQTAGACWNGINELTNLDRRPATNRIKLRGRSNKVRNIISARSTKRLSLKVDVVAEINSAVHARFMARMPMRAQGARASRTTSATSPPPPVRGSTL